MSKKVNLNFEVKRERKDRDHGAAIVYCNGHFVVRFEDHIKEIKPGEQYCGKLIRGRASIIPDAYFIKAALFPEINNGRRHNTMIKLLLDYETKAEQQEAKRRPVKV